jgi:hypothetical protein
MEHHELGVALAVERIAELRRQADRWRLASRLPDRTTGRHRDRPPGSLRLAGRPGQAADGAGGGRAAAVAAARGPGRATKEGAMLTQHSHEPGLFDAGHCWACARQAGLLDHYRRVQREEARLQETQEWACMARRFAIVALGSSGAALLLAALALLTR